MIAKCIVLSNIISVVPDNILRTYIHKPLLILKKFIVLLHTLSAYNSLLASSFDLPNCEFTNSMIKNDFMRDLNKLIGAPTKFNNVSIK